jgi:hypothetical protein
MVGLVAPVAQEVLALGQVVVALELLALLELSLVVP